MKTLFYLSLLSILSFSSIFSQPNLQWDTRWNGPIYNDEGKLVAVDNEGNVIMAGTSDSTTYKDWLIIKYNPAGEILWTKRYNGTGNGDDEPKALKIDGQGNVYVTGYILTQYPAYKDNEMITMKYSKNGILEWSVIDDYSKIGLDLVVDIYGNVYVGGGSYDYESGYVIKYNSNGIKQWTKHVGNWQGNEIVKFIDLDIFGNIIIVIDKRSTYNINFQVHELNPLTGDYILKYDLGVGLPKAFNINKTNGDIYILSDFGSQGRIFLYKFLYHTVQEAWYHDQDGNNIIAIDFKLDKLNNCYYLCSKKINNNYFQNVSKIGPSGSSIWSKNYNFSPGYDNSPAQIALTNNTDPPDILTSGYTSLGNILTMKVKNYNGDTLWTKTYDCGTNGLDIANAMVLDECDNMYITGSSSCNGTYKDIKTIKYSTLDAPVITVTGTLPLCLGQQVTLSVPQCGGCTYLWSSGQTTHSITVSPTETTTFKVTVTNSSLCEVSSLPKEVIVNPMLTPSVSIIANKTEICAGDNVIFTATPINGGLNPVYDWYVDGVKKSSGGLNSFSSTTLANGAVVKCIITSNASCLTTPTATSNEIQMTVNPKLTASVSIQASKSIICAGQSVTFTALPVNGGTAPTYKWYVNNTLKAETTDQFTATDLANGAKVYAEMYSNALCVTPLKATSNSLVITVNPLVTPSVSIAASSSSVCFGQNITFTATPVKEGTNPVYQWYINNELQSINTAIFSSSSLPVGSVQVYCIMTSSEECVTQTTANSNFISVAVNPLVVPKAKINASSTAVFVCEEVIFNVTPTNGGVSPSYKWFVNSNLVGTGASYKSSSLLNGSKVYCIMTSTANCVSTPTVNSDTVTISVFPLPQPEINLKHDTISVTNYSGAQYKYSWYYKGALISNDPYVICGKYGSGSYYVIISLNTCTVTSNTVEITCTTATKDVINANDFIIYPNPTDNKIFIEGKTIKSEKYSVALYNMLGVKLEERMINSSNYNISTEFDLKSRINGIYMIAIISSNYKKVFMVEKF